MTTNGTKLNFCPQGQWNNIIQNTYLAEGEKTYPNAEHQKAKQLEIRIKGLKLSEQVPSL